MHTNPTDDMEMPKTEKKLPPKLTKQEALKLLEIVYNYPYPYTYQRYRNYAIFATFVYAGLRKSELLRLKMVDVDLANQSIYIHQGVLTPIY
jgi:integrase